MSMFDQFKNLKGLSGLMNQLPEMKQKMQEMQDELAKKTVQAEAGAGAVRVTVNGKFEVTNVELDKAMLGSLTGEADEAGEGEIGADDNDLAMAEDLILAATNEAMRRAQDMAKEEMGKLTGGMNLPGLDQLMGGAPGTPE